jgi:hypothetical protein
MHRAVLAVLASASACQPRCSRDPPESAFERADGGLALPFPLPPHGDWSPSATDAGSTASSPPDGEFPADVEILSGPIGRTIDKYVGVGPTAEGKLVDEDDLEDLVDELLDIKLLGTFIDRGRKTSRFPAVGAIVAIDGRHVRRMVCTATAIAPTQIVTAAHCLYDRHRKQYVSQAHEQYFFIAKANAFLASGRYRLRDFRVPDRYIADGRLDVGTATLETALELPAYPKLATAPQPLGFRVVKVGYGYWAPAPSSGDPRPRSWSIGERATVIAKITALNPSPWFQYEASDPPSAEICYGDSGGPAFVVDRGDLYIVGVTLGAPGKALCHTRGYDTLIPGEARRWLTGP